MLPIKNTTEITFVGGTDECVSKDVYEREHFENTSE